MLFGTSPATGDPRHGQADRVRQAGAPSRPATKDRMTVAREIDLKDPLETWVRRWRVKSRGPRNVVGTQRDARVVGSRSARLSVRIVRVLTGAISDRWSGDRRGREERPCGERV